MRLPFLNKYPYFHEEDNNMWMILAVIGMVALDQVVKYWAYTHLQFMQSVPLIDGVFQLTYVENRGMAFSLLQGQRWFFVVTTVAVVGIIIAALCKGYIQTTLGKVAMALCIGGALGNFIDRLLRGFVVDLFDFCLINFPVFNIADMFVVCSAILFFYYIIFQHKDEETPSNTPLFGKKKAQSQPDATSEGEST